MMKVTWNCEPELDEEILEVSKRGNSVFLQNKEGFEFTLSKELVDAIIAVRLGDGVTITNRILSDRGKRREEIEEAIREYEKEGFNVNNADYDALEQAIVEEYESGQQGSIADIIEDLSGSIGLDVFGIVEPE